MSTIINKTAVAAVAALLAWTTSAAADANLAPPATELSSPKIESVSIGFAPPIGERLRYQRTKTYRNEGESVTSVSTTDFRFTERDGGYRLESIPVDVRIEGDGPTAERMRSRSAFSAPVIFLLDHDGLIEGIEGEAELRETLINQLRQSAAPGADATVIDWLVELVRGLDPDELRALFLDEVGFLVESASSEYDLNETLEYEQELPTPGGDPVTARSKLRAFLSSDRLVNFQVRSEFTPDQLGHSIQQLLQPLIDRASAAGNGEELTRLTHYLREARMTRAVVQNAKVDPDSGLTLEYEHVDEIGFEHPIGNSNRTEITTIKRL